MQIRTYKYLGRRLNYLRDHLPLENGVSSHNPAMVLPYVPFSFPLLHLAGEIAIQTPLIASRSFASLSRRFYPLRRFLSISHTVQIPSRFKGVTIPLEKKLGVGLERACKGRESSLVWEHGRISVFRAIPRLTPRRLVASFWLWREISNHLEVTRSIDMRSLDLRAGALMSNLKEGHFPASSVSPKSRHSQHYLSHSRLFEKCEISLNTSLPCRPGHLEWNSQSLTPSPRFSLLPKAVSIQDKIVGRQSLPVSCWLLLFFPLFSSNS